MAPMWLLLVLTPVSCLLETDEGRHCVSLLTQTFGAEFAVGSPGAGRDDAQLPACPSSSSPGGVRVQKQHLGTPELGAVAPLCRHPRALIVTVAHVEGDDCVRPWCGGNCVPAKFTRCGPSPEHVTVTHSRMESAWVERG